MLKLNKKFVGIGLVLAGLWNITGLMDVPAQGRISSTAAQVRGRVSSNTTRSSGVPSRSSSSRATTSNKTPAANNSNGKPTETKELSVSKRTVNGKEQVILESK
jgi:cytoskeletal protein RodZ